MIVCINVLSSSASLSPLHYWDQPNLTSSQVSCTPASWLFNPNVKDMMSLSSSFTLAIHTSSISCLATWMVSQAWGSRTLGIRGIYNTSQASCVCAKSLHSQTSSCHKGVSPLPLSITPDMTATQSPAPLRLQPPQIQQNAKTFPFGSPQPIFLGAAKSISSQCETGLCQSSA